MNSACKHPSTLMPMSWRKIAVSIFLLLCAVTARAELNVLIVEGLGGEAAYQKQFNKEATALQTVSLSVTSAKHVQLLAGAAATRANILAAIKQLAATLKAQDRLVMYLIGHGSYDGYTYKFNLPGTDLSGAELAAMLNMIKSEHQLVVATGSCSGALQELLKNDARIVVTATRSGNERNITQFGQYFVDALVAADADTDKNGRISTQEAFDLTSRKVKDYYQAESRLATEHAQLSGARAALFNVSQLPDAQVMPVNASDSARREQLANEIYELRLRKESLSEEVYLQQLEALLLQLAELDAGVQADSVNTASEVAP